RAGLALAVTAVSGVLCFARGTQSPVPFEASAVAVLGQFSMAHAVHERHLVAPLRPALPFVPSTDGPSVLLILHESLSADAMFDGVGYRGRFDTHKVSPFSAQLPSRAADGFNTLLYARSNSTATETSVPTVLSGLDLGAKEDAYGTAESIWALGK